MGSRRRDVPVRTPILRAMSVVLVAATAGARAATTVHMILLMSSSALR